MRNAHGPMSLLIRGLLALLLACGLFGAAGAPAFAAATVVPASTSDVTYPGVGGVTLAGTLVIPAHAAGSRVPGVVIIAGSGPTDRNGNSKLVPLVSNQYAQWATALAGAGIASLRYDKRAIGASSSVPLKDPAHPTAEELAAFTDFAAWGNFVGDAAATLAFLQQQPAVDGTRTALLGHSEGSLIAQEVAAAPQSLPHPPAAVVLASGPGRPFDVLAREQISNLLPAVAAAGVPITDAQALLTAYDAEIAGIKATGQTPTAPLVALQQNANIPAAIKNIIFSLFPSVNTKYWVGALKADPVALAKAYAGPVLVIQGGADTQVFPTEDAPALDAALASRSGDRHQTVIVPQMSHEWKLIQDPTKDNGFEGPVVPAALTALTGWLAPVLGATPVPEVGMPRTGVPAGLLLPEALGAGLAAIAAGAWLRRRGRVPIAA